MLQNLSKKLCSKYEQAAIVALFAALCKRNSPALVDFNGYMKAAHLLNQKVCFKLISYCINTTCASIVTRQECELMSNLAMNAPSRFVAANEFLSPNSRRTAAYARRGQETRRRRKTRLSFVRGGFRVDLESKKAR